MLSKIWTALAVSLTLPLLNGCGNDDANEGQVRIVNATTEYATVDLYDVDSKNDSNLLLGGTASDTVSAYAGLTEGTYSFNVVGAGASSTTAGTTGSSVTKQDHFVLVTYLTGGAAQASFIPEEETAPTSGNAKLRIFNAASGEAGGVDVYVTSDACTALADTDTALTTNVTGLQTSFNQILATSTGSQWNVCVTATGNKNGLLLAVPAVTFTDQQIATLILTHTPGGVLLNGMLLNQQGALTSYPNTLARVRLVADAASAGAVSATVNNVDLTAGAGDLPSPSIGTYVAVPAGALATTLDIDDVAISGLDLTANAGADYTLFVAGTVGAPNVQLLADDNSPSSSTALPVKMRVVNGLNGLVGGVRMTSDGNAVAAAATFGTASAYALIPDADDSADLEADVGSTNIWSDTEQTLDSGAVYTVFLLGDYPSAPDYVLSVDRAATPVSTPVSGASF